MSHLRRVIPPSRRSDRSLAVSIAATIVFLLVAIAKPWGTPGTPLRSFPSFAAVPSGVPSPTGAVLGRRDLYAPALFGGKAPSPAWELWPAGYVVDFGFAGPLTIRGETEPRESPLPTPAPAPSPTIRSPFAAMPAIRLGQSDNLVVLGINSPDDVRVTAIRLWRSAGGAPARIQIETLPPPWPIDHFHVIGISTDDPSGGLGSWQPGIYRLDLLTEPGDLVRSVVAIVDPPGGHGPAPKAETASPPSLVMDPRDLLGGVTAAGADALVLFEPRPRSVRDAATLARKTPCTVGELWQTEVTKGRQCSAIAAHDLGAIAVRRNGTSIVSLTLHEVDPIDAPVGNLRLWEPEVGLAILARTDGRPLDEGTYRLEVAGSDHQTSLWYVRVSPADRTGN
jgi:hypothetical protein